MKPSRTEESVRAAAQSCMSLPPDTHTVVEWAAVVTDIQAQTFIQAGGVRDMTRGAKEPIRNDANQTLPQKPINEMNASERNEKKAKRTGKTMP